MAKSLGTKSITWSSIGVLIRMFVEHFQAYDMIGVEGILRGVKTPKTKFGKPGYGEAFPIDVENGWIDAGMYT